MWTLIVGLMTLGFLAVLITVWMLATARSNREIDKNLAKLDQITADQFKRLNSLDTWR